MAEETPFAVGPLLATPPSIPSYYFNGFTAGLTNADVSMTLQIDGAPAVKLNMSFTMAKTMASILESLVGKLQDSTGQKIMTTDEVGKGLEKLQKTERNV